MFVSGGHHALKFDAFHRGAHWHSDPDGTNDIYAINDSAPLLWTANVIANKLGELLRAAGYEEAAAELEHDPALRARVENIGMALGI